MLLYLIIVKDTHKHTHEYGHVPLTMQAILYRRFKRKGNQIMRQNIMMGHHCIWVDLDSNGVLVNYTIIINIKQQ